EVRQAAAGVGALVRGAAKRPGVPHRSSRWSRRRSPCWFFVISRLTARPPLLSGVVSRRGGHDLMLVLEVAVPEVRAFYRPPGAAPNVGGYLGRVFPGGSFLGLDYEGLFSLGTGSHDVLADERARGSRGEEPPIFHSQRLSSRPRTRATSFQLWGRRQSC